MGRNVLPPSAEHRAKTRILEIGCGSGANLWMIAREGFQTCGLDLSEEGLVQAGVMLRNWQVTAELKIASMTAIPREDGIFDTVLDVVSSFCLLEGDFARCRAEVSRVLRPGGLLFIYTPGKRSDAFLRPSPGQCPVAEAHYQRGLAAAFPAMTEADVERVIAAASLALGDNGWHL